MVLQRQSLEGIATEAINPECIRKMYTSTRCYEDDASDYNYTGDSCLIYIMGMPGIVDFDTASLLSRGLLSCLREDGETLPAGIRTNSYFVSLAEANSSFVAGVLYGQKNQIRWFARRLEKNSFMKIDLPDGIIKDVAITAKNQRATILPLVQAEEALPEAYRTLFGSLMSYR